MDSERRRETNGETMKTLMIELPDELYTKIHALPKDERAPYVADAFQQDLQPRLSDAIGEMLFAEWIHAQEITPEEDAVEVVQIVNEAIDAIEGGERGYSFEELLERYGVTMEDVMNAKDGIINGQAK